MNKEEMEIWFEDEDNSASYNQTYVKTVENYFAGIEDENERNELKAEFEKFNRVHSTNPHADASLNLLRAKENLRKQDELRSPELREAMNFHDAHTGKDKTFKTSAKKVLTDADKDNAYLQSIGV
ncbi:MAG: hypothetical protein JRF50_16015 [Deltaproteobacteria bacterium]|nr:hypothetical protein [Deltaproteobacteria bacterium]